MDCSLSLSPKPAKKVQKVKCPSSVATHAEEFLKGATTGTNVQSWEDSTSGNEIIKAGFKKRKQVAVSNRNASRINVFQNRQEDGQTV